MAYIGKDYKTIKSGLSPTQQAKVVDTMTGNGSATTLSLSTSPGTVNNVRIWIDGVFQTPGTEYTLSGSTITFTTAPFNGAVVLAISGATINVNKSISPKPISISKIANSAVTNAKIVDIAASKLTGNLPAISGANLTNLPAANLTGTVADARISTLTSSKLSGALPAISGASLTGIPATYTKSSSDPVITTNPSGGVGTVWVNQSSGEVYVCTDATSNENVWTNIGGGSGDVKLQWYGGRGVHMGGTTNTSYGGHTDNMSYVAISTPGNAADFGNMTNSRLGGIGTASNNTRLVMAGGSNNYPTSLNTMDYITVASTGNATDYGDLTTACRYKGGVSNGTRGVYAGGYEAGSDPGAVASIDYRDVASTGNCSDFGDLSAAGQAGQHWSNGTRAIIASVGGNTNVIEYITVASTGNSTDFGDMTESSYSDTVSYTHLTLPTNREV